MLGRRPAVGGRHDGSVGWASTSRVRRSTKVSLVPQTQHSCAPFAASLLLLLVPLLVDPLVLVLLALQLVDPLVEVRLVPTAEAEVEAVVVDSRT